MKIIKKKCPYCGADTGYKYGDHELKCTHCRQSCIIEYERPSFSDLLKMKEYCEDNIKRLDKQICNESDICYLMEPPEEMLNAIHEQAEKLDRMRESWGEKLVACEQMLGEAIEVEIIKE